MQVADVNKVLMAVNQMVEAGNAVHFEKDNHHIFNYSTGCRTEMEELNGQYTFDMWVPNLGEPAQQHPKKKSVNSFQALENEEDSDEEEVAETTPFQRPHKD